MATLRELSERAILPTQSTRHFNLNRPEGHPHGKVRHDAVPCQNPYCDHVCDPGGSRRRNKGGFVYCWACRHGLRRLLRQQPERVPDDERQLAYRALTVQRELVEQGRDPWQAAEFLDLVAARNSMQAQRERLARADDAERRNGHHQAQPQSVAEFERACLSCSRTPRDAGVPPGTRLPPRCPRCGGSWWVTRLGSDDLDSVA